MIVVVAVVGVVVGLGIAVAVLAAHGGTHPVSASQSRVCTQARQALESVRQPLQDGDIPGTIQAAQAALLKTQSLAHQPGVSPAVNENLKGLVGALQATANGSAASIPRAGKQLADACKP
jgi:hypothetical protein